MAAESYSWHPVMRSILDHWVWKEKPFSKGQAWVDMILLAHHNPCKRVINGVLIPMDEGQLAWPKYLLADRWGWSRDKVERYLKMLEADGMLSQQTSHLTTVITLLNYKELRKAAFNRQGNPVDNGQGNAQGNARETYESQYKKEEELKNEKKAREEAAVTFRLPVRSEEAVAHAAAQRADRQGQVTQAILDRALTVLNLYPSKAKKDGRPVAKSLNDQNLLARKIAESPDYPWEAHARLMGSNPTPPDLWKWVEKMPDPIALAGLQEAIAKPQASPKENPADFHLSYRPPEDDFL